ncbi:MAG TPA: hypothetical protein VI357_11800 [Mycobacteriales bacterium]
MADINDRLDRLQRREEFDRFGRPIRLAESAGPVVSRPAGVDDRLGEVLDAVAAVVSRHPGLSVMVAVADGRVGRPVVRVTERDGGVETGVVVPGGQSGRAAMAAAPDEQAAAVPSATAPVRAAEFGREPALAATTYEAALTGTDPEGGYGGGPVPERMPAREALAAPFAAEPGGPVTPAREAAPFGAAADREAMPDREPAYGSAVPPSARDTTRPMAMPAGDPVFEAPGQGGASRVPAYRPAVRDAAVPAGDPVFEPGGREVNGRHAARPDEAPGWTGNSWHNSLWSKNRGRPEPDRRPEGDWPSTAADRRPEHDRPPAPSGRWADADPQAERERWTQPDHLNPDYRSEPDHRAQQDYRDQQDLGQRDYRGQQDWGQQDRGQQDSGEPIYRGGQDRGQQDRVQQDPGPQGYQGRQDRGRQDRGRQDRGQQESGEQDWRGEQDRATPEGVADERPTIPVAGDTSQVVTRLAQLLRENPTLASSWSREEPE